MARRKRWSEKRDGSSQLTALGLREMLTRYTESLVVAQADAARSAERLRGLGLRDEHPASGVEAYTHALELLAAMTLGEFGQERPTTPSTPAPAAGGEA